MEQKSLKEIMNPQSKKVHVCYSIGKAPKNGEKACLYELEESYITLCRYDDSSVTVKVSSVEYISENVCIVEAEDEIFIVKIILYK